MPQYWAQASGVTQHAVQTQLLHALVHLIRTNPLMIYSSSGQRALGVADDAQDHDLLQPLVHVTARNCEDVHPVVLSFRHLICRSWQHQKWVRRVLDDV